MSLDILQAIVLGITQGLTEFLPVSSSGHLILIPWLFGWDQPSLSFDAALHLGTLAALFAYFRDDILNMIRAIPLALKQPKRSMQFKEGSTEGKLTSAEEEQLLSAKLGWLILIGSIPAGIVGLLTQNMIETYFHDDQHVDRAVITVALLLILFGVLLYAADVFGRKDRSMRKMQIPDVVAIGVAQALALLPGVSRSGVTLTAGLARGLRREDAARFSFLLGVPLITIAGLKGLVDILNASPDFAEIINLVVGMVTAGVVGFLAIWGLLRYLSTESTGIFALYRVLVGVGVLLLVAVGFR